MEIKIDDEAAKKAVERMTGLTGLTQDDAVKLLQAHLIGSADLAVETIAGSGPIATSMTAARAEHLKFTCLMLGRIVTERETGVLLRSPATTARSALTQMKATYEEALREQFLEQMRHGAAVRATGTDDGGLTWEVEFSEVGPFELFMEAIVRFPIPLADVDVVRSRQRATIPRVVEGRDVLKELGIEGPKKS